MCVCVCVCVWMEGCVCVHVRGRLKTGQRGHSSDGVAARDFLRLLHRELVRPSWSKERRGHGKRSVAVCQQRLRGGASWGSKRLSADEQTAPETIAHLEKDEVGTNFIWVFTTVRESSPVDDKLDIRSDVGGRDDTSALR